LSWGRNPLAVQLLFALLVLLATTTPTVAQEPAYATGFIRWRAAEDGFHDWERDGIRLGAGGRPQLDGLTARQETDPYPPGGFHGQGFFNGGSFLVGETLSPITPTEFGFSEAVASWNVHTPSGTWTETQIRVRLGGRWTKWYSLGVWADDSYTVQRHSVDRQDDVDASVDTDTLVLSASAGSADAFQLKLRLFSTDPITVPNVRNVAVAYSTHPVSHSAPTLGDPDKWGRTLPITECSQMVYPDGGEVWCSPTSTAMVLGYWTHEHRRCEPRVRSVVAGVYDWLYDGHGNWPFNTAYAATQTWRGKLQGHGGRAWSRSPVRRARGQNLEGYIARFSSLAQAEEWIAAGVPIIASLSWGANTLTGAPFISSDGHLVVLVGFDAAGNPVVNDPGAPADDLVQRTYLRTEFEPLWLGHTGGTVYLIYPPDWRVPDL
jgi:hypothetical protein